MTCLVVIRHVRHGGIRRFVERGDARRLHPAHVARIGRILAALDRDDALEALSAPTFRLYPLKGDRKGFWSVRVSDNWRFVFRLEDGHVFDVDLTDYHYQDDMSESEGNVRYDARLRRNPPHPGGHIGDWMEDLDGTRMTVIAAAARLGISKPALSRVLNGRASISPSLALKLEAVGWGMADMWNSMQAHYDLAQERNRIGQWRPDLPREDASEAAKHVAHRA